MSSYANLTTGGPGAHYKGSEWPAFVLSRAIESELDGHLGPIGVEVGSELGRLCHLFEHAVEAVLRALLPGKVVAEILFSEGVWAWDVYATLTGAGAGAGVWDGRWKDYLPEGTDADELSTTLKRTLSWWADEYGTGLLVEAFDSRAYDAVYAASKED